MASRLRVTRNGRCGCWPTVSSNLGLQRRRVTRDGAAGSKTSCLKPWQRVGWMVPPQGNAAFVAAMEKVLDVYCRPYDAAFPAACMDETPRQGWISDYPALGDPVVRMREAWSSGESGAGNLHAGFGEGELETRPWESD